MKNISKLFFLSVLAFVVNCETTVAQSTLKNRMAELTITGGAWLNTPGKIYYSRNNLYLKKNTSALLKAMGDVYINKHFALGLYLNYSPYNHPNLTNTTPTTINMFEYGAGFKPVFYFSDKTAMKLGCNVGLRTTMSDAENLNGKGLGVNLSVEIQHQINDFAAVTIEPGFLAQPIGFTGPGVKNTGETTYKYAYPPVFYINVGIAIFTKRS